MLTTLTVRLIAAVNSSALLTRLTRLVAPLKHSDETRPTDTRRLTAGGYGRAASETLLSLLAMSVGGIALLVNSFPNLIFAQLGLILGICALLAAGLHMVLAFGRRDTLRNALVEILSVAGVAFVAVSVCLWLIETALVLIAELPLAVFH